MIGKLCRWYMKRGFKGIHELDKLGGLSSTQKATLRKKVGILLIDDRDAEVIADTLEKKHGFSCIKPIKECPDDSLVQSYPIIVVDVDGITAENTNGLRLAKHIKNRYPLKQVIISSGQLKLSKYKDDLRDVHMLNGIYEKTRDNNEKLASLIDDSIINLYDPRLVWRNVRGELLSRNDSLASDTDILNLALEEEIFVQEVLARNRGASIEKLDWLEVIISVGKLSTAVLKLLSTIKGI